MTPMRALERQDGHLPIGDHALIGDGHGCALVGRDASIAWMCVPRFDDPPLFCGLLDADRGGSFRLFAEVLEAEQRYLEDTAVLVTTVRTPTGVCEVTDAFLLHPGARLDVEPTPGVGALLRRVRVLSGSVLLDPAVEPRGGAERTPYADGWALRAARFPDLDLHLSVHPAPDAAGPWRLEAGHEVDVVLRWGAGSGRRRRSPSAPAPSSGSRTAPGRSPRPAPGARRRRTSPGAPRPARWRRAPSRGTARSPGPDRPGAARAR